MIRKDRVEITAVMGFVILFILIVMAAWVAEFLIRQIGFVMLNLPGVILFVAVVGVFFWMRRKMSGGPRI